MREAPAVLKAVTKAVGKKRGAKIIFFSPSGKQFDNTYARALSKKKDVVFICGHYEGVDARVKKALRAEEVSVGPFVLTGGEVPAMTIIDAVSRFLPGVLGLHIGFQ